MGKLTNKTTNEQIEIVDEQASQQSSVNQSTRIIMLHSEINEFTISYVIGQLFQLASISHDPIHLVISTYGGSVDEMLSLYDVIKFLPCPIHTIALGKVMSAGVLLLASGTKGNRMIGKSARIMIHPIMGQMGGNIFELANECKEQQRLQDLMIECLQKETKMSKKKINEIMKSGHDYFLLPNEAIKIGIVDKIIGE
jgi:ATP-dependent Clp protease protease subunit